jgi:hypothetical protein
MQELTPSCAAADVSAESYEETLLLVLTPPSYSSNNTADIPGGHAFISPAQVGHEDLGSVCLAVMSSAEGACPVRATRAFLREDGGRAMIAV